MYNIFKIYKYLFTYKYYLLIFFLFWFSINTGSKYITYEFIKNEFFSNKFNFFRAILPYLILLKFVLYDFFLIEKNIKIRYFFRVISFIQLYTINRINIL